MKVCLISSQVQSTGLCHLSVFASERLCLPIINEQMHHATPGHYSSPKVVWPRSRPRGILFLTMRVNIKARIPMHLYQEFHSLPLVLTIETAHGLAARCEHRTTAAQLMWTLDQKTDINAGLLDRFRQKLRLIEEAHLSDVEVSDEVLNMFGFFL